MNNQRGGILSRILVIPLGAACMAGFFFLGYYVGKYQTRSSAGTEKTPPLPEIESASAPKQEEYTFYKTLTDKEEKTISIDLKPGASAPDKQADKKPANAGPVEDKTSQPPQNDKKTDNKSEKDKAGESKQARTVQPSQDRQASSGRSLKLRYTLQIASYQEKEIADEDVKKMKKEGYAAFVVASEVEGKGTWYRVRLGSFANKASAEKLQKEVRSKTGISPYITLE